MNLRSLTSSWWYVLFAILVLLPVSQANAHGELVWNDFTIDNKNDSIVASIQHIRKTISDVVLARRDVPDWPDQQLQRLGDELAHLEEEHDALLNYFKQEQGVNLNSTDELRENPRAGRSLVASYAMEVTIALVEYIASLDGPKAFEEDLHMSGKGAYMFDLMDAYLDTMGLYAELLKASE